METRRGKLGVQQYFVRAAIYQPSLGQTRRTLVLVFLLLTVLLIGIATRANIG